ncbi:hypothetical protein GCM10025788_00140 [Serinicoccus chungangensis]
MANRGQCAQVPSATGRTLAAQPRYGALRNTLATQAINRGMPLEAIAATLGRKSMDITLCRVPVSVEALN